DLAQLLKVGRPQQVVDIGERSLAKRAQSLMLDHEHILAHHFFDPDAADIELAIRRLIRPERKQWRVVIGGRGVGRARRVHENFLRIAGRLSLNVMPYGFWKAILNT